MKLDSILWNISTEVLNIIFPFCCQNDKKLEYYNVSPSSDSDLVSNLIKHLSKFQTFCIRLK